MRDTFEEYVHCYTCGGYGTRRGDGWVIRCDDCFEKRQKHMKALEEAIKQTQAMKALEKI